VISFSRDLFLESNNNLLKNPKKIKLFYCLWPLDHRNENPQPTSFQLSPTETSKEKQRPANFFEPQFTISLKDEQYKIRWVLCIKSKYLLDDLNLYTTKVYRIVWIQSKLTTHRIPPAAGHSERADRLEYIEKQKLVCKWTCECSLLYKSVN